MVISAFAGVDSPIVVKETPKLEQTVIRDASSNKKEVERMMSTEEYIKNYFADIPIMIQIARCESTFRQLSKTGEVHRGRVNSKDVGVMQINEYYHLDTSIEKDYNIYTIEGNTAYARDLYEREGTTPWNSSKPCWGKYENVNLAVNK